MSGLTLFCAVVALFCGASCGAAYLQGLHDGQQRQRRRSMLVDSKKFIRALTQTMEVQADGGDSPEDYVAWCVLEAEKIAKQDDTP